MVNRVIVGEKGVDVRWMFPSGAFILPVGQVDEKLVIHHPSSIINPVSMSISSNFALRNAVDNRVPLLVRN